MSGEVDRARDRVAILRDQSIRAKQENKFDKMDETEFSQMDWVKLKQELDTDPNTGKTYQESRNEKFSRKFGSNPFILIGKSKSLLNWFGIYFAKNYCTFV